MKNIGLIGYTGFVGSNILKQIQEINKTYNSKNISDIIGEEFDLLIIAGVSANKQFANMNPEEDLAKITELSNILSYVKADKVVLISTIDVYHHDAYGSNRLKFENMINSNTNFKSVKVLRLPGLFGKGLKKNVIFDIKNLIPTFIKEEKFNELAEKDHFIKDWYSLDKSKKIYVVIEKNKEVEQHFIDLGFTSLNFSNANSDFYWFNLDNISKEIYKVLNDSNIYSTTTILNDEAISNKDLIKALALDGSLFKSPNEIHYSDIKIIDCHKRYYGKMGVIDEIKDFLNDTSC